VSLFFKFLAVVPGFLKASEKLAQWVLLECQRHRLSKLSKEFDSEIAITEKSGDTSSLDNMFEEDRP
jgi:hypothetical protein